MIKILLLTFITALMGQYSYSLEDYNSTSPTYGLDVWSPEYSDYITLHYFSSQGWGGWTSTFGQLSDFQEELRSDGYENVVIIAVGQSNISTFNSNFCSNSDLPLVMDTYPSLPIREQFAPNGLHKQVVIIGYDGNLLGTYSLNSGLNSSARNYIADVIDANYQQALVGDVNGDDMINVLDVVQLVNIILSNDNNSSGDINADGTINVLDVVQLVNLILG